MYPGGDLVNDADGGVVVVEIQYRLGLFGERIGDTKTESMLIVSRILSRFSGKSKGCSQRWAACVQLLVSDPLTCYY